MTLLRARPLVLVSSAIAGLENVREDLHAELSGLDLADDWVFEFHAAAAGEPAQAQYLDIARSCDLMVLILGAARSEATEDEYHEAFRDNPDKILPFYMGAAEPDAKPFRKLIDGRHSRMQLDSGKDLVGEAVLAVEHAVRTGRVVMRAIREGLEGHLDHLDRLLDVDPPRAFFPRLALQGGVVGYTDALDRSPQLVVSGIGGSGKTYGALVQLYRLCSTRPVSAGTGGAASLDVVTPLYLRASPAAVTMEALIYRAFNEVRFLPGPDLISDLAHEGRLAVVVDRYDNLTAAARLALLQSVEDWASTYPRCRVIVLARELPTGALEAFGRAEPAPLGQDQLEEIFAAYGQYVRGTDVPPELTELVQWPFWANAIARFGLDVTSGLELLQRMASRRVELAAPNEPVRQEKLRQALGVLSLTAHPGVSLPQSAALNALHGWQTRADVAARFESEPSESLLQAVCETGLVDKEDDDATFIHPLLASVLAAEVALTCDSLPPAVIGSDELLTFVAALLPDRRREDLVGLLEERDVFFLARVVRLSPATTRANDFEADLVRYSDALGRLRKLAGDSCKSDRGIVNVAAAFDVGWTAIREVNGDVQLLGDDYDALLALPGPDETVAVWQRSPFVDRAPERVAAAEVLWRFKRAFDRFASVPPLLAPDRPREEPPADQDELAELILIRARALAEQELALRAEAGLATSDTLPRLGGEPHITVLSRDYGRFVVEEWGHDQPDVSFQIDPDADVRFDNVPSFLAGDAKEVATARLRATVEKEIGSAISSGAWNRPSALAGWIW